MKRESSESKRNEITKAKVKKETRKEKEETTSRK